MPDSPLFSVIIPTYNRAAKVVRAVNSVLNQTLTNFDVWVIDDGSTDETAACLAPYNGAIHYLPVPNGRVARARNTGIQKSAGRYIAFLDSDDFWFAEKLNKFSSAIQNNPQAKLFFSPMEVHGEDGNLLWIEKGRPLSKNPYLSLLMGNYIAISSVVICRDALDMTEVFDPSLHACEDWDLWLRIAHHFPVCCVPEVLGVIENAAHDRMTSQVDVWLQAHDDVIAKAFKDSPELKQSELTAILANISFTKGRICLQEGHANEASQWFNKALSINPLHLKAQIFRLLTDKPTLRRMLPERMIQRLHLTQRT
jgi:glycosyltransferase involved in cell wall biosynthesis